MRVPSRLIAVALFVVVGMLALVLAGMLDWIVGVLFLTMEFLGQFVRSVFRRRRHRRHQPSRSRHASTIHRQTVEGHRGYVRRRGRPRRRHAEHREDDEKAPASSDERLKILVPVTGDEADLLDFALEECRTRQAEMIVLFLRPMGVTPMGPNPLPGLLEDDEARATFDRLGSEADRVGVPLRTIYATTADLPATIGEFARATKADVVILGSPRRVGFSRFLSRDPTPSILKLLPERASLTIRAS
jgi:nucleotide-binding universal stress UspA family protein/membrane protein implicated in regulation of membrane protease activity